MDPHLLEILVCPVCKGPLQFQQAQNQLVCTADKFAFPVRDGIPVMLESEAQHLDAGTANATNEQPQPSGADKFKPSADGT